mgnify:CR=1 FL=1
MAGGLIEHGARVWLAGRDAEALARTAAELGPAATEPARRPAAEPAAAVSARAPVSRILYVDDDESMAFLVRRFLETMQARDLPAAQQMLAPGFEMRFPGAAPMSRLEQLVEWGRGRYQRVGKTYERFDESWGDEATVVHCSGTLHGVWLDGSAFEGIRFIDRFEIVDGLITRQDVWNDLAEVRPRA